MSNSTNGVDSAKLLDGYYYSISTSSNSNNMNMQDFLMLVVAQLQNQDMYSSSNDNGQFMAQMAQVASMQAMQELTASFMSSMAVNYIGKYVRAEAVTSNLEKVEKEGFVERVNFNGGDVMVLVGDVWFKVRDIYEISKDAPEVNEPEDPEDPENPEGGGD